MNGEHHQEADGCGKIRKLNLHFPILPNPCCADVLYHSPRGGNRFLKRTRRRAKRSCRMRDTTIDVLAEFFINGSTSSVTATMSSPRVLCLGFRPLMCFLLCFYFALFISLTVADPSAADFFGAAVPVRLGCGRSGAAGHPAADPG